MSSGVAVLGAPADSPTGPTTRAACSSTPARSGRSTDPGFPPSQDLWTRQLARHPAGRRRGRLAPRPLPGAARIRGRVGAVFDARVLADGHGEAELRIIAGAAHDLRHDPRAVAILLGWLDRQRHGLGGRAACRRNPADPLNAGGGAADHG